MAKTAVIGVLAFVFGYGFFVRTVAGRFLRKVLYAVFSASSRRLLVGPTKKKWSFEMEVQRAILVQLHWANIPETRASFAMATAPLPPWVTFPAKSPTKINSDDNGNLLGYWIGVDRTAPGGSVKSSIAASSDSPVPTVLYLHGGAYCYLSPRSYAPLIGNIVRAIGGGARAFAPDYRLAPEHPHPAAVLDCVAAYAHLLKEGIDAGNIVIIGDSAGGGLVMATLLSLREQGTPMPRRAVPISPWVDLRGKPQSFEQFIDTDIFGANGIETWESCARYYAGSHSLASPLISPVLAELSGLPELLIHVGGSEQLLSNAIDLEAKCRQDGVTCTLKVWEEMFHDFHMVPSCPDGVLAIDEIAAFCRK